MILRPRRRGGSWGRRSVVRAGIGLGVIGVLVTGHVLDARRDPQMRHYAVRAEPLEHARALRGRARRASGRVRRELTEEAEQALARAWDASCGGRPPAADVAHATIVTARLLAADGQFDTARAWLDRVVRARDQVGDHAASGALLERAHLERRSGALEEAAAGYARLVHDARTPRRVREAAWHAIATLERARGFHEAAIRTWMRLVEQATTPKARVDAWCAIARIARREGRSTIITAELDELFHRLRSELDEAVERGDEGARVARARLRRHS